MLTITPFGAAGDVTGSNTVVDFGGEQFAVDCGMFQGEREAQAKNLAPFPYDVSKIQAVVLTHAHLDHCGRLPKLVKDGFRGFIFATPATIELTEIVLKDAVHVAEDRQRRDGTPMPYLLADVTRCISQFRGVEYNAPFALTNHARGHLVDAGHVLGSASVVVDVAGKRLVFSGDIGNPGAPIVNDPAPIDHADVVLMEATYGDKTHDQIPDRLQAFHQELDRVLARNGTVIIPAFSLERTQELLYGFAGWQNDPILAKVPVFVDSPMAIEMLDVYRRHVAEFDSEAQAQAHGNHDPFLFSRLRLTPTVEASKAIKSVPNPKIIIAGSGMMDGGRVQYHLQDYLPDPNATVLVVGYQAQGTLGRKLVDGQKPILIHGRPINVRAHIETVNYLSAHADEPALLRWLSSIKGVSTVILNHSEEASRQALAPKVEAATHAKVVLPKPGEVIRID